MDPPIVQGTRPVNIAFDLDGTLIDSAPDICAVAAAVLRPRGIAELTIEETRDFVGAGSAVFVRRMMAARDIAEAPGVHAALYDEFMSHYEKTVDRATFYPGAREALDTLRADGRRLGLCTNKPQAPTRAVLNHMGLDGVFDAVIAGGMLDSRKPEPDMLLALQRQLGEEPLLYVGDSETDAETAARATVPFALFSGGYRKTPVEQLHHDWVFDHFKDLGDVVAQAEEAVCRAGTISG